MLKKCTECKQIKDSDEFPTERSKKDNKKPQCKECCVNRARKYYAQNVLKERRRKQIYSATPAGKEVAIRKTKNAIKKWRWKYNTRQKTKYYIKIGLIEKKSCQICGDIKVHAHHLDYSNPWLIEWYCAMHHRVIEGKQKYLVNVV